MTEALYLTEPYRRDAPGIVTGHTPEGGLVVHNPLFYPTGGGQPGDSGVLDWNGVEIPIATAVKADGGGSVLVAAEPVMLPPVGAHVTQRLDWERRHRHMRMHTALHLLSVVIALPVTGGQVSADRGRLDFNMPEAPEDRDAIEDALNALVDRDLQVTEDWITEEELDTNPGLVKTMSVQPPRGAGVIRLVRIGEGSGQVDLQPCGGTHVARTGEIGHIRLGKIENKGRQNRRVNLHLR
ncbi:alanyl-tRNA editing protein [Primorskyibacter flagellatus]|uniref:alanyl-tRNA editing protein n=1 Tax=Primorskyibacter flagellatus TaxID=1387277 RepID=UPI003A900E67